MRLEDLPDGLLNGLVRRAREVQPDSSGIFAFGSYARGSAGASSDLDLQIVTVTNPGVDFRTWFVDGLHVSLSAKTIDQIRARCAEPMGWALWFTVDSPGIWVWSTAEAVDALGDPPGFSHPAGPPELETFVEWCGKALRAADPLTLRVAARGVGSEAPALLRDFNPPVTVHSRAGAVRAALAFTTAPKGWADDLPALLGLEPADDERVHLAVARLARGTLALLRERRSRAGEEQPDLNGYLLDGTLERHLGFE